jgi:hypothetical protein
VANAGNRALYAYFVARLSKPVQIDLTTGYVLEKEALEIERGATSAVRTVLRSKPKASGVSFALSRTDLIRTGAPFTGALRIVPMVYGENYELTSAFVSPAVTTATA